MNRKMTDKKAMVLVPLQDSISPLCLGRCEPAWVCGVCVCGQGQSSQRGTTQADFKKTTHQTFRESLQGTCMRVVLWLMCSSPPRVSKTPYKEVLQT